LNAKENIKLKKVILMGLDNSGKSSIVYCLRGVRNLMSFVSLNPTKDYDIANFEALGSKYSIWDFGGQEQFRNEHLEKLDKHFTGTDKLIYVIDVQDSERFDLAVDYLKKILDYLINSKVRLEFSIFLHKWDPDLALFNRAIDYKRVNKLIKEVKDLVPPEFPYKFQKTSIYTLFEKTDID